MAGGGKTIIILMLSVSALVGFFIILQGVSVFQTSRDETETATINVKCVDYVYTLRYPSYDRGAPQ